MQLLLITFVVSCASILYEFFLTHTMISLIGGTTLQYTVCIGIFTFALGIGALFYNKIKFKKTIYNFQLVEICLATIGALSPLFLLILFKFIGLNLFFVATSYFTVFIIGFLSGIELPFLMDLYNNKEQSYSGKILFTDYIGTLFGSIIYPIILIDYFDLFSLSILIGLLNLITALLINYKNKMIIFLIIVFCILLYNKETLFYNFLNYVYNFN